ncbi:MAG: acetylglutamate kinase [Candidatus Dadabacteria bacterium]|nr:acetylglutamate kinase [Candidatus Dadabacteria bacterium]MYA48526.1 acetylglutamate kinase [Candidatus Dadabacteria bacterium]MYF47784.1 acetylglutamate kinase [Candidatus Dadabacteria bacterium]MYG82297.1 acetylglutamate kinase [Candidatus Dadabacteria bacterium]MYK49514.1 acetylglutamate kinase [Candidatus Dadabacteria bacterium]
MDNSAKRAEILVEALPYIEAFHGKTVVVKYGGSVASEDLANFVRDLILMKYVGIKPVVVHGGGPQIQEHLDSLGIKSDFLAGLRVTDERVMEVVEMVLVGKINQQIVTSINKHQMETVGLSGKEGKLIKAKKFNLQKFAAEHKIDIPEDSDLGYVGEVQEINPEIIKVLEGKDVIPIIAPIGAGEDGTTYNINADHAAGKIAGALRAAKLILLTNVDGILDKERKLISSVTKKQAAELIRSGTINSGMIPKVMCALEALEEGVNKVHIINGTVKRALILELLTDSGIGTEITL